MEIFEAVVERLASLDYTISEGDKSAAVYSINKAEASLKASTNQFILPDGLFYVWTDMAAGIFLTDKKASGALAEVYDFSAPVKSVSEGDTSVTYAVTDSGTFESKFDTMLDKMLHPDPETILKYRRLAW